MLCGRVKLHSSRPDLAHDFYVVHELARKSVDLVDDYGSDPSLLRFLSAQAEKSLQRWAICGFGRLSFISEDFEDFPAVSLAEIPALALLSLQ